MITFPRLYEPSFISTELDQLIRAFDEPMFPRFREKFIDQAMKPRIDLSESTHEYFIEAELPGLKKEEISVEFIDEKTIKIQGKTERQNTCQSNCNGATIKDKSDDESSKCNSTCIKKRDKNNSKNPQVTYWCKERSIGEFNRTISLSLGVDRDHVKASLENGLLRIVIPKLSSSTTKKITIN